MWEAKEEPVLDSMREGQWVGQGRWTLVAKGFASPCGDAHSWRNPRSPKSLFVPFPTEAVDCPDRG